MAPGFVRLHSYSTTARRGRALAGQGRASMNSIAAGLWPTHHLGGTAATYDRRTAPTHPKSGKTSDPPKLLAPPLPRDAGPASAETLPAVRRRGFQLLAHDTPAVAYADERPRRRECPVAERWVIGPGGHPLVRLTYKRSIDIVRQLTGVVAFEEHLRDRPLANTPENQ